MTKLIIKTLIMLTIVIGISNYVLYIKTGKMPFNLDTLFSSNSSGGSTTVPALPQLLNNSSKPVKEEVYKWVDDKGVTHFSKQKPPETKNAESIEVGNNINLMKGVPVAKREASKTQINTDDFSYNPKNVKKLIDDAQNVEKLLNDRYKEQEKTLNGL